jgi:hypothetical protein
MTTTQEMEEALNANDTVFGELPDQLEALCESLGLDPDKYSFHITVHEEAEDEN